MPDPASLNLDADWRHQAVHGNYAERHPQLPLPGLRIWAYTDALSYAQGETVGLSVTTNAATYRLEIWRDGAERMPMLCQNDLPGQWHETPATCSIDGCGWPVSRWIAIPGDWPSGGYVIRTSALAGGIVVDHHDHLFLVRPAAAARDRLLLIAATASWTAYNDWGGSNHYQGFCGPTADRYSPVLSIHRPYAKGFVTLPHDAPRGVLTKAPAMASEPRYPQMEWAYANGYSKKYASAGWASYDRHFVRWAEAEGFGVDVIAQTDLQTCQGVLDGYACVVMVGHDEYWSWEMRDAVDDFVDRGGKAARFAGNFMWQIRLEDKGARQICYKYAAQTDDPLIHIGPRDRVTESWEAAEIGRPGSASFGLNATQGLYASWSGCSPRGAKGFTVYRPEHWAFAGTGLYYGDLLGAESCIFGYEVDGLGYEIRGGLPYATNAPHDAEGFDIVALGLAATLEEGPSIRPGETFLGTEDGDYVASVLLGHADAGTVESSKRGAGMIVNFRRGAGEVFHAGTCDWVAGLLRRDEAVMQVTRTVLQRYLSTQVATSR